MINHPATLIGNTVHLIPLKTEHFSALEIVAGNKKIWQFYSVDGSAPNALAPIFEAAFKEREKGTQYPFAIYHTTEQKIIGSTRFTEIQAQHKRLK